MSTDIWLFEEPLRRLSQIERRSCQLQRELEHWLFLPTRNMSPLSKKGAKLSGGLEVRGCEIKFIIKKLLESKNPCGFVTQTFKVGITNPQGFFDLSNFYLVKLVSQPLLVDK